MEKSKKNGAVLEERDGGWMILETANDQVEDSIEGRQQVHLKLELGDDGYLYMGWFTVCDVKGFELILGQRMGSRYTTKVLYRSSNKRNVYNSR